MDDDPTCLPLRLDIKKQRCQPQPGHHMLSDRSHPEDALTSCERRERKDQVSSEAVRGGTSSDLIEQLASHSISAANPAVATTLLAARAIRADTCLSARCEDKAIPHTDRTRPARSSATGRTRSGAGSIDDGAIWPVEVHCASGVAAQPRARLPAR